MSEPNSTHNAGSEDDTAATNAQGALIGTRRAALTAAAAAAAGFLAERALAPSRAEAVEEPITSVNELTGAHIDLPGLEPGGHLPPTVEIGSPPPTGVTATDTANVKAALRAAGEANGVAVLNKPGIYKVNEELIRPHTASIIIGPNTTLQATAPFTGTSLLTDSKTEKSEWCSILGGGRLDSNNVANHALFARYFGHMTFGVLCMNSLEDDVILGDEAATASSYEAYLTAAFWVNRNSGAVPVGHYCMWAQNCSDGRIEGCVFKGQETGVRIDKGGWRGWGAHPYGAAYAMQVCVESRAGSEWFGPNFDTPTPNAHASATGEAASSTITDTAILPQHESRPVTGTNIPAESFVGAVTTGEHFTLVNKLGESVNPTGSVSGITLLGVGLLQRGEAAFRVAGGAIFNSAAYGVDNGCVGIVVGKNITQGDIDGFESNGSSGGARVTKLLTGKLLAVRWRGLIEKNTVEKTTAWESVESLTANLKAREAQATPGFELQDNGVVRLRGGYEATGTIASLTKLFLLPTRARPASEIKVAIRTSVGAVWLTIKTNGEVNINEELKTAGFFSLDGVTFAVA
ncbi:MAG TPA: hypothetical protein VIH92_06700 [Solirubrobacteraceae bacterium]